MLVKHDQRLICYKAHVCLKFDWSKTGLLPSDWSVIFLHQICFKIVISKLIVRLKDTLCTLPGPVCWMSLLSRYLSFTPFW